MLRSNVVEVFPLLAGRVEELDTGDDVRSRTCALVDRLRRWYRPGLRCLRGLRIGELAGLTRRRVDLLRGTVEVAEIVTRWRAASVVALPKTRAGRCTVGLPRRVVAELEEHLAAYTAPGVTAPVFPARWAARCGSPRSEAGYAGQRPSRRAWTG